MPKIVQYSLYDKRNVLTHNYFTTKDIQVVMDCGVHTAESFRANYFLWVAKKGIKNYYSNRVYQEFFRVYLTEECNITLPSVIDIDKQILQERKVLEKLERVRVYEKEEVESRESSSNASNIVSYR